MKLAAIGFGNPTARMAKEAKLEIEEIIKKIDGIKKTIDDAFEKGAIDFDQITGELEMISSELRANENASDSERSRRLLLKTKDLAEHKKIISVGDYR